MRNLLRLRRITFQMIRSRSWAWAVPTLVLSLFPSRGLATSVVPPDFDSLVIQSDFIVRAVVRSVDAEWRNDGPNRTIITKVELNVSEVIKGTPPVPLVLELLGGIIGAEEMLVEGAPKFHVGDENVLFVQGNGRQYVPLVGIMYGKYPVVHDGSLGADIILRSNGMALYDVRDVDQPMTETKPATAAGARPLTASEFSGKIRATLAQRPPTAPVNAN